MKKTFDVIGFGALNLDRLYRVERIAKPGEHEKILDAFEAPGGSAANTIAGLANLGLKTGFAGAVGTDSAAEILLNDFRKRKVNAKGIIKIKGFSGTALGFIDKSGERTLYPYPGVNNLLSKKDVGMYYFNKAKIIHMTSFVGEKQFAIQKDTVKKLKGTKLSFSPGDLYTRKGLTALMPLIKKTSILFLNESEIKELTKAGYVEGSRILLYCGAKTVVVTLGAKGCFVADDNISIHVPAKKTRVVDTTGAGDAFAAGFLYTIVRGGSVVEAAVNGNKAASICIRETGARTCLACRKDLI
jgi:ribokinase